MNPKVVGVVRARQAKGITAAFADLGFQPFLIDRVHIKRRIGEDEIELAVRVVRVVVIAVDVAPVRNNFV